MHKQSTGVSLVEVLIALAVFSVILVIAYMAINGSLQAQSDSEAITSAQGRLRRVTEVLTQDLRSAVFGSIVNEPYSSTDSQVSILMLTGAAGYAVMPPESINGFPDARYVEVQGANAADLTGSEVVMINSKSRNGVVLPITSVTSGSIHGTYRLHHNCRNTITYDRNNLLVFAVQSTGVRFDRDAQMLRTATGGLEEAPLAFDISDFQIEYIYTAPGEMPQIHAAPIVNEASGVPVRNYQDGAGTLWTLTRLHFSVSALAEGSRVNRNETVAAQVDLSRAEHYQVEEIVPCR